VALRRIFISSWISLNWRARFYLVMYRFLDSIVAVMVMSDAMSRLTQETEQF